MSPWQLWWCPWCGVSWDSEKLILVMADPEQSDPDQGSRTSAQEKEQQSVGVTGLAAADF